MSLDPHIPIAEDDTTAHAGWRSTLNSWGYDVAIAEDGEAALELIRKLSPQVLLADVKMPPMDGLGLLRNMNSLGLNLATIMISGRGDFPEVVEAMKLGALDYLCKPVDLARLQGMLDYLLRQATLWEETVQKRRNGSSHES